VIVEPIPMPNSTRGAFRLGHGIDIFRIEFAPPEAVKGEIVVAAEHAVPLGIEHVPALAERA
jgi:hypothetical protein